MLDQTGPVVGGEFPMDPRDLEADTLLRRLVYLANRGEVNVGLTVHAGGTLVSGKLISRSEYHRLLTEQLRKGVGDRKSGKAVSELLAQLGEAVERDEDKDRTDAELLQMERSTSHLHLKDAVIADSSGDALYRRFLWRGRLRGVDGWTLGAAESLRRR